MKQASRVIDSQKTNIVQYLRQQLTSSQALLDEKEVQNEIKQMMHYRQQKIYYFFSNDLNAYFGTIWEHIISDNPDFQQVILNKMYDRQKNIYEDLINQRLKIQQRQPLLPFDYDQQSKLNKLNLLKQQSDDLKQKIKQINNNLDSDNNENQFKDHKQLYAKLYSQQKLKQTEESVKKYKQEQIERRKKLIQQKKKEEEQLAKKEAQIKQQQEEVLKERKEEILRKQKQNHQLRSKQKQLRQQRNTQYMRIKKQINEKPPLYKKLYEGYSKRYDQQQNQRLTKMHSERKMYMKHANSQIIQKHSKQYDQFKQKKQKERKQKKQMEQNKQKSRTKVHSSYEIKKMPDPKEIEKELAKQKIEKMKQYRSIVKQKFKPKIDQDKKRQLMNMIQEMQLNHKRVKRVRLDNGSVMYEELPPVDAKMIGMSYLQQTKQMAARARQKKKEDKDVVETDLSKQIKKPINYLQELRKNRPTASRKHSVVERKNMSFDDKIKHVMQESDRLAQVTKQNQMMLKFGKFKTSQQILACKQQIDQNYLDIVNMKLKLILSQQNPDTESQYSHN